MPQTKPIIFFDGVCNLCNGAVNFIIDHDKESKFLFAPLQSNVAKKLLSHQYTTELSSIILYQEGNILRKSSAALTIAKQLDGPIKMAGIFLVTPAFLRDFFYDIIAKYRYSWFGKRDFCRIPTPEIKKRFIEMDE